jgi:hypothetical protein
MRKTYSTDVIKHQIRLNSTLTHTHSHIYNNENNINLEHKSPTKLANKRNKPRVSSPYYFWPINLLIFLSKTFITNSVSVRAMTSLSSIPNNRNRTSLKAPFTKLVIVSTSDPSISTEDPPLITAQVKTIVHQVLSHTSTVLSVTSK